MVIQLCKVGIERLGPGRAALLDALREREHMPVVKDCLDRCQVCERGWLVAVADGMPLGMPDAATLLASIDQLASADEDP